MNAVLTSIVAFLFAIGVLVAVHEWGHYIVARMAGVKVLRFSIGFGKPLWLRRSGPDQTEYCLAAIPLGGYVKLLDEREGEVAPEDAGRAFNHKSVFARVAKEEKWYEVGDVTAGKGIEVAAAVQVQKRMVLEHAVRVHPQLLPKAKQLECGFGEPTQALPKVDPADPANAGFVGRADASGRYGECGGCKNAPPDKYPQLLTLTPFAPMPLSLTGKTQGEIDTLEPTSLRKATKSIADAGGSADRDSKGRM